MLSSHENTRFHNPAISQYCSGLKPFLVKSHDFIYCYCYFMWLILQIELKRRAIDSLLGTFSKLRTLLVLEFFWSMTVCLSYLSMAENSVTLRWISKELNAKTRRSIFSADERISQRPTLPQSSSVCYHDLTRPLPCHALWPGSSHGLCLDDLDIKSLLREDDDDDQQHENSGDKVWVCCTPNNDKKVLFWACELIGSLSLTSLPGPDELELLNRAK